jgi:O-antigen/teichoic acid export membrane protein
LRPMANHAFVYFLAFAMPGAFGFFAFSIYTRILSPEEYALYSIGTSVSFLIGSVAYGWIRFSVGRYQAESPAANFLPFLLVCYAAVTTLLVPVIGISSFLIKSLPVAAVLAVWALTMSQALFDISQEIRRARGQSVAFAEATIGRSILSFSFAVAGAFYFFSGAGLVFGIATGFAIMAVRFLVKNRTWLLRHTLAPTEVKRFLAYGMPLTLSGLAFAGNSTAARAMVATLLGASDAGQFGAALDVTTQLAGIVAASVSAIVAPIAIRACREGGVAAATARLGDGAELMLAALAPATAGLIILAQSFGDIVVGPRFEHAAQVLIPVLALSRAIDAFSQYYLHLGFQIIERPSLQIVCGGATVIINISLAAILLPTYGVQGAVYGLLIGDIVGAVVSFLLLRMMFPMPIKIHSLARVGVCTALMVAACAPLAHSLEGRPLLSLLFVPMAGVLIYGAAAYALDIAKIRTQSLRFRFSEAKGQLL